MASRIDTWTRWIEGPVHLGVIRMHFHRQIWRGVQKIIHQLPPSAYWAYHVEVYVDAQAIAVRRQADLGRRVASLGRLIAEIGEDPELLTEEWWLERWGPQDEGDREFARGRWKNDFAGKVGTHIDPEIVHADSVRLTGQAEAVRTYVNRHVAHAEDLERFDAPAAANITVKELDTAIDTIGELFRRYADLLVCVDVDLHVHMLPDWLAPFRQPWIHEQT